MRTAQIEVAGKKLLVVECPLEASNIHQGYKNTIHWRMPHSSHKEQFDCNIKLIGTITSTEIYFDCSEFVELMKVEGYGGGYKNYEHEKSIGAEQFKKDFLLHGDPKDSFYSLLSSQGIHFKNPLGEEPKETFEATGYFSGHPVINYNHDFVEQHKKWNEAENQLWKKAVVIEIKP